MNPLDLILKATLLLLLVALGARSLRRDAPAAAHFAWLLGFAGLLALPWLAVWLPTQRVPMPRPVSAVMSPETTPRIVPSRPLRPLPNQPTPESPAPHPAQGLTLVWPLGAALALARLATGLLALRPLRRRAAPFAPDVVDLEVLSDRARLPRVPDVRIAQTPDVETAMTWGLYPPIVLLPREAHGWSPERLDAVLLHEFAHVRRRDFASGLLAEAVCALYWFHPLVWLGARAARADAESAADDAVLCAGIPASAYAAELLGLATELAPRRKARLRLGVSTMTHPKIEPRLKSVLAPRSLRRGLTLPQAAAVIAVGLLTVPALARLRVVSADRPREEVTLALQRLKSLSRGTLLYTMDYDERYPYAHSVAQAKKITAPYTRSMEDFDSPAEGGVFLYYTRLAGVAMNTLESPPSTPLWYERLRDPKQRFGLGFADGHVKIQPATQRPAVEAAWKNRRITTINPRPAPPAAAERGK